MTKHITREILLGLADEYAVMRTIHVRTSPRIEEARTAFIAALDQLFAERQIVPEGWKLVPVEPTEAMRNAGDRFCGMGTCSGDEKYIWDAMLAAAPTPGDK